MRYYFLEYLLHVRYGNEVFVGDVACPTMTWRPVTIYHTWHMEHGIIHVMREAEGKLYSFRMYLCLYY